MLLYISIQVETRTTIHVCSYYCSTKKGALPYSCNRAATELQQSCNRAAIDLYRSTIQVFSNYYSTEKGAVQERSLAFLCRQQSPEKKKYHQKKSILGHIYSGIRKISCFSMSSAVTWKKKKYHIY
jgi:hypothetical protein